METAIPFVLLFSYARGCFLCTFIYAPRIDLVPMEPRRGHQTLWTWSLQTTVSRHMGVWI